MQETTYSGPVPEELGGAGRGALASVVLNEEMQLARAPIDAMGVSIIVAAILRNGEVQRVDKDTVFHEGDRVVLFATKEAIRKVERLFAVRLEFF